MANKYQSIRNGVREVLVELVKGSYIPADTRFPNRFKKTGGFDDYMDNLASRWFHTWLGVSEGIGALSLIAHGILRRDVLSLSAGYILGLDAASRVGAGQGIVATVREMYGDLVGSRKNKRI
mgnify:CR=1 FL=1